MAQDATASDLFLHKTSGAFITGFDKLNGRCSELKQAVQKKMAARAAREEQVKKKKEEQENAIVFTFSTPPPPPRLPPLRAKQEPFNAPIPFRDELDEAFARMFRKETTLVDVCLRGMFAVYSCNWIPMAELFAMLHKYGILVITTLPLITCKLPELPVGLLETPWGWHFPYFQTRQFGSTVVYRLSPVFLRVMQ